MIGLGPDLLATRSRALVAYGLPLLLATIVAGALQVLLSRSREAIPDALLTSLFRWAIAFAALCLLGRARYSPGTCFSALPGA